MTNKEHPTPTPVALRALLGIPAAAPDAVLHFNDPQTCDVILRVLPSSQILFLHKPVLTAASEFFHVMWASDFAEASADYAEIAAPESEDLALACLAHLYSVAAAAPPANLEGKVAGAAHLPSGVISFETALEKDLLGVLITSEYLQIGCIRDLCYARCGTQRTLLVKPDSIIHFGACRFPTKWGLIVQDARFSFPLLSPSVVDDLVSRIPTSTTFKVPALSRISHNSYHGCTHADVNLRCYRCNGCATIDNGTYVSIRPALDALLRWGKDAESHIVQSAVGRLIDKVSQARLSVEDMQALHAAFPESMSKALSFDVLAKLLV
ncbi:hypothetical protein DFJ73DRAFT_846307 [Zopfochytrium polystomum]|nr:hypothetical protein DFJ73DRAFT_846307 [Zopfochytrium polystomum]